MLPTKINTLTPEQEKWIPVYQKKWKQITLSTERIDVKKFSEDIKTAYGLLGKPEPNILFFESPKAVMSVLKKQLEGSLQKPLKKTLKIELKRQLQEQLSATSIPYLDTQLLHQLCNRLVSDQRSNFEKDLWRELKTEFNDTKASNLHSQLSIRLYDFMKMGGCFCVAPQLDFYISVLNLPHNPRQWEAYQLLMNHGTYILAFDRVCLISDRPTHLSFDMEERFHAEAEPAIQFADGFLRQYIYHGVKLPEAYGMLHPHQWQVQWILGERNAEVRRLLIQTLGYGRICQELQAQEVDSYQGYTLLRIDEADVEPMYLLKMTCPSTGYIHALRVPPNIGSAREAIRWVNWGTEPKEFAIQT